MNLADKPMASRDHEPDVWSPDEARRFRDFIAGDRLEALWHLNCTTGLRRGEFLASRWSEVDLDRGVLRVERSRTVVRWQVIEGAPKTAKSRRTIALDQASVEVLCQHRERQGFERRAAQEIWTETGYVFTTPIGEPLHPDWIGKRWRSW